MSRFIVQEPGPYLLWAEAPTGRKIQILINGADVGIVRESYLGPWSRRDIDAERDLATGVAVTTMPEDARLIEGAFPHVNRHIHGLDRYINCGTQVDDFHFYWEPVGVVLQCVTDFKNQLGLERHAGRVPAGLWAPRGRAPARPQRRHLVQLADRRARRALPHQLRPTELPILTGQTI